MIWLGILGALLLLVLLWFCVEQNLLLVRKKQITLERLPREWDGIKLLQISDIHHRELGRENCRIVQKARELQPDYMVITGDLVSRDMQDFSGTASFLRQLRSICPVYLCPGNHELDLSQGVWMELQKVIGASGCHLLLNETVTLSRNPGGAPLYLAGATLASNIYRDENRGFRHLAEYTAADLEQALGQPQGCTLLLAHNPFLLDTYAGWGADLVLCGHVHGGLVRLPLVGGVLSPERRFFPEYDKGLYQKGKTQMYVSGGLGKPRFCNPPEINLLYLNSDQT